ncbi:formylglycine-generating enzyme family protein [Leptothoe spongobia TAU-MAC 1115]|uniref:Formylglycine-generating enzyme family protein n=2 Tax=Leptothoe TaxID=2651725 RepID=A0A947DIS8_9CYAN|nr:formylglycine-generating enzyme family protein [Leptothoe spongobia TAU-MAC 1115]
MLVPGGEFWMGAAEDEPDSQDSERPRHLVQMSRFLMGRYPVTQAQWKAVTGLEKEEIDLNPDPSRFKGDHRPVEQVSWFEAVEFCQRLSAQTSREYGLPSEAEWEYACRAGAETPYHFGEKITTEIVNYYDNDSKREYRGETTPVNYFGVANALGLCDMHGNVDEWCQDHWHENYKEAPTHGIAWLTSNQNTIRILRGGSWYTEPRACRSAARYNSSPDNRSYNFGFRVVCRAPGTLP